MAKVDDVGVQTIRETTIVTQNSDGFTVNQLVILSECEGIRDDTVTSSNISTNIRHLDRSSWCS